MDTEEENRQNFSTPNKERITQDPHSTNAKWGDSQIKQASQEQENYEQRIEDIQNKIKETGQKLQSNYNARKQHTDKLTEQYLDLENERRIYKLDLINFNYAHLRCFTLNAIEEKQRKEAEQNQRMAQQEQKKRINEQLLAKIKAQQKEINEKKKYLQSDKKTYQQFKNSEQKKNRYKYNVKEKGQLDALQIAKIQSRIALYNVQDALRRSRDLYQAQVIARSAYKYRYGYYDYYPYLYSSEYLSYPYSSRYDYYYDRIYGYPSFYSRLRYY